MLEGYYVNLPFLLQETASWKRSTPRRGGSSRRRGRKQHVEEEEEGKAQSWLKRNKKNQRERERESWMDSTSRSYGRTPTNLPSFYLIYLRWRSRLVRASGRRGRCAIRHGGFLRLGELIPPPLFHSGGYSFPSSFCLLFSFFPVLYPWLLLRLVGAFLAS